MSDSERIASIEQWQKDFEKNMNRSMKGMAETLTRHDARCDELDTFKKKWVFGIILIGVVFGSLGTFIITNSDWIWDSIPVPKHMHQHHHDEDGNMIMGEGFWGA